MTHVLQLPFINTVWTPVVLANHVKNVYDDADDDDLLFKTNFELRFYHISIRFVKFTTVTLQLRVLICSQYVLGMNVFDSPLALCLAIWSP